MIRFSNSIFSKTEETPHCKETPLIDTVYRRISTRSIQRHKFRRHYHRSFRENRGLELCQRGVLSTVIYNATLYHSFTSCPPRTHLHSAVARSQPLALSSQDPDSNKPPTVQEREHIGAVCPSNVLRAKRYVIWGIYTSRTPNWVKTGAN